MAKLKLLKYFPIDSIEKCDLVLEKLKMAMTRSLFLEAEAQITQHIDSTLIQAYFNSKVDEIKLKYSSARVNKLLNHCQPNKKQSIKSKNNKKKVYNSLDLDSLLGKQIHEVSHITSFKSRKLINLIKKIDKEVTLISRFTDKHLTFVKNQLLQSWQSNQSKAVVIRTEFWPAISPINYIGKELKELALAYNRPLTELLYLLKQKDKEITGDTLLTEYHIQILKEFLVHAASLDARHAKKETAEVRKIPKNTKQKPTLGQQGNYYKLIYNHPKQ